MASDQLAIVWKEARMETNEVSELPLNSEDNGLSREVYALLAQANLLRMRGRWEEAVQKCMAALTLAPNHSSAQSLLGDIYENQGRYDDAVQWYHMALDVNPDSPADRIKLDRLIQLREQEPPRSRFQQFSERRILEDVNTGRGWRISPETALRAASLTAALFVIIIVGFAYFTIHRHAALVSLGLASDQQEVEIKPVVVPPSIDFSVTATSRSVHDAAEQVLLDALRASADISSQGIIIYDVQADPRSLTLAISFGVTSGTNGSLSRDNVLRSALRIAQDASALPGGQTATLFTTRCIETSAPGADTSGLSLIFIGNIVPGSLPGNPAAASLTTPQLQALFTNPWWSTSISN